ncbi:hypothetical protein LCGC14_1502820 [marine sediment metagenome]|uniref:Uncharacterized protein n=1 Tax=marine sediment metagenome TaxID=412755 RepID=A0A0F9JPH1_9ZZZZ
MDPLTLGIGISMIGANVAVLGLVLRIAVNGKPRKAGNPHAMNPDDIRLGDMSLAYYKTECVDPIIRAIEGNK